MKKVGLITFFINNYGSLMQAYATKTFLIKNGYTPVLIQKEPFGITEEEYKNNLKKHPEFEKDFKSFMDSLVKNDSLVPEESEKEMDAFREKVLQVSRFTMPEIRDMGQSDEYMAFIVGSDQVWNTTIGIVDEYFFLGFAPQHKRIALCPSFGAGSVHEYLRDEISDALNGFEALSSREDEGVRLIKELTGRDALRLSDPTILLTTEEWKEFAGVSGADEKGYLMLHFLDKPYDIAVKNVKKIIKETGMKVKCFAARHEEFSDIDGIELVTGGPKEYIKTIANAGLVCTDSFHTSIFAINLDSDFYTFDRQYVHGVTQISRITTLLKRYGLTDRLILGDNDKIDTNNMSISTDTNESKNSERKTLSEYLLKELAKRK